MQIKIPSLIMKSQQFTDVFNVENAAVPASVGQKQIPDEVAQPAAEPMAEGNGKTALGSVDDFIGKKPLHGALKQDLGGSSMDLEIRWDSSRKLDQFMIKQGRPGLDGVCHAHPVYLREDVQRQRTVKIQILNGRKPAAGAFSQQIKAVLPGIVTGHEFQHLSSK